MHTFRTVHINLSTSGRRLGGAAIASEFHSRYLAEHLQVELWRMWDEDAETFLDKLKIKNFLSKTRLGFLDNKIPKRLRAVFLDSKILNHLLRYRPDIVHIHNPLPAFAFENIAFQGSKAGIKVVASTHGFFEVMFASYNFRFYEKWLWEQTVANPILRSLNHLDLIFTLYPDEQNLLMTNGVPEEKIFLIGNGVNPFFLDKPDISECGDVIDKFNLNLDNPILFYIGNHTANKGLDTVFKLAQHLMQPVTIVIGGRLLSADEPQMWYSRFPPNPLVKIVFTDYLSLVDQRALYHLSYLLLFPSVSDTLPLSTIEAMACGLPVVAYDVGGIPYQLMNNCGFIVPKGCFLDYLQIVEKLLKSPNLCKQIAENAKKRQKDIFSWDIIAKRTIEAYARLMES